jgi:flavin reductase (DIM6/NTAB) family NADH-FMN oxidoreductase RutF
MKAHDQTMHEALRQIPYGLYVIGVRAGGDGEMNAMAASWVTQCSFYPPLIMVAVRKPSRTYDLVKSGGTYKKERRIVRTLEKPFRAAGNKVGKVAHVEEDTGAPILRLAFAYLECKVREIYEPGDHALIIGEVVHAGVRGKGEPIMCSDLKRHYGG